MSDSKGKIVDQYPWLGMDVEAISSDLRRHYHLTLSRTDPQTRGQFLYRAAVLTVRDRLVERWYKTRSKYRKKRQKRVAYLSLEFLMGRALNNALLNLGLEVEMHTAVHSFGCDLEDIESYERDAGLGNGGLGRLAACFLDSCATIGYPVTGYGIRYDYGIFFQQIIKGYQHEVPDRWLAGGNPWEIRSDENTRVVKYGGHTEIAQGDHPGVKVNWISTDDVLAVPYDVPIPGYHNDRVNTLRLWKAEATDAFSLHDFNSGEHEEAMAAGNAASQISKVLYPNDVSVNGKVLRLRQQYFLTSASLQDVIHRWIKFYGKDFDRFSGENCFQLNDTHPAVAVAELMRLLIDEHGLEWDRAWEITTSSMAYTNHTLLPEALERWPVSMFRDLLPRLLEIIYNINQIFLEEVQEKWPGDLDKMREMSIIDENGEHYIRMAYLAIVGSFSINGVAALHTKLLKQGLFRNFYELWPHKFNNKTNGVTPRRWLAFCNQGLAELITSKIGDQWITDLDELHNLKDFARDEKFQKKWHKVKQQNKQKLVDLVAERTGVVFDTSMLFDVQVKRIHEYKRQLLNVLHVIHLYDRIRRGETKDVVPRCVLFGGKAAPGYAIAKLIIKLINSVADVVNSDEKTESLLRVAFLPNYQVSAMEVICPGTDLSEQISTAGKEASGTGNMKFMMNGALTIGTLDGANIEIRSAVGEENFFLFGLTAEQVEKTRKDYHPNTIIANDREFLHVMELLEKDHFNKDEPGLFAPLSESIRSPYDAWMTAADFRSFVDAQRKAAALYQDKSHWTEKSILNTAWSGRFSSDRTIREYATDIWGLETQEGDSQELMRKEA